MFKNTKIDLTRVTTKRAGAAHDGDFIQVTNGIRWQPGDCRHEGADLERKIADLQALSPDLVVMLAIEQPLAKGGPAYITLYKSGTKRRRRQHHKIPDNGSGWAKTNSKVTQLAR